METLRIGNVSCDYIEPDAFENLCRQWLTSDRFHHVVTLNPEMVVAAKHDSAFAKAVQAAEIRVPDGSGLIWARWYLRSKYWSLWPSLIGFLRRPAERITGVDAVFTLARLAQEHQKTMYLLGGEANHTEKTAALLRKKYPSLIVHSNDSDITDIQATQPAVLLVAYGVPKQTLWIEEHRAQLPSVRVAIGVGGAFAILSEHTPRAPRLLRDHNMEWMWRLLLEPRRLPRIWRATIDFPLLVSRQRSRVK